ncbi:helix-turn-helix domain-containing protein [Nocardia blacklockiae]|uniref:helix-turn-helix domain-containing protein n=1 Tax=Nocardia blacklockiae TaxID=480036 RepID=UPI0018935442|nr:AraC family transcriptional regulator [Nocardia blacklockiae]MBF6169937.1 helix-turn-helix transcriptional regulator [Nocardia blacklockiae]
MAVLIDTATVPPRDRVELIAAALQRASAPARVVLTEPERPVHGRIEEWRFGDAALVRARMGGYRYARTPNLVRVAPSPQLLIMVSPTGVTRWAQDGDRHEFVSGRLWVADLNRPYDADWCGGEIMALQVPLAQLDMPADTVRRAAERLPGSPLYALAATHVAMTALVADTLPGDPGSRDFGSGCVELVRALLTSAATGAGDGTALPTDVLLARIRDYVRRHLADPDLDAARIARAHHISVRYLYKLCAQADFSLRQSIIEQRLDQVRRDLASPRHQHRPIAAIAQHRGFRDPSHFARRFRIAFGMTPREWRHAARQAAGREDVTVRAQPASSR